MWLMSLPCRMKTLPVQTHLLKRGDHLAVLRYRLLSALHLLDSVSDWLLLDLLLAWPAHLASVSSAVGLKGWLHLAVRVMRGLVFPEAETM